MTLEAFKKMVEEGLFNDYDGHGRYATETEMLANPESFVMPSMIDTLDLNWTHIVWFNK